MVDERRAFFYRTGMTDPRIDKLAHMLINYSCDVNPGELVLIEAIDVPHAFTNALVRETAAAGGRPTVMLKSNEIQRALLQAATVEQWQAIADVERLQMEKVQC
jgi:aminopeptidase